MGGRGSIWGTIGGVAIFAVLDNLMSVMQFNPFLKDVIRGLVIIVAVALYARRRIIARRIRFAQAPQGPNIATDNRAGSETPQTENLGERTAVTGEGSRS